MVKRNLKNKQHFVMYQLSIEIGMAGCRIV